MRIPTGADWWQFASFAAMGFASVAFVLTVIVSV